MYPRIILLGSAVLLMMIHTVFLLPKGHADRLEFKDGSQVEGVIQKIDKGKVTVQFGNETKVYDILEINTMDFDTSNLPAGTDRLPLEHFLSSMEAREMVGHIQGVEKAAAEIRYLTDQVKLEWANRKSISSSEIPQWEKTKEQFRRPLSRYQEVLNDFYFHVLGKVDEYNRLTKEANEVYVGVKGVFSVGSPLIPRELGKLPLKKYVPSTWYDTIFYEGYNRGYSDAHELYGTE